MTATTTSRPSPRARGTQRSTPLLTFPARSAALPRASGTRWALRAHLAVSAYAEPLVPGFDEDAQLAVLDDPTTEVINAETYGGLKALCERGLARMVRRGCRRASLSKGAAPQVPGAPVSIVRPDVRRRAL